VLDPRLIGHALKEQRIASVATRLMCAVCKGQFSVRDRGAAAAMGEAPRERELRPIVIIAAGTMRPISFATALWKLEPFPSQARAGQCARASNTRQDCEMRSRLAMRQLAICSRSGMNFATHPEF
jgi:hypothetical protein